MDREVSLLRMHELANACVSVGDSLLEEDTLDEYFKHMLGRWVILTARIAECSGGKEFQWDEAVATKMWIKEMKANCEKYTNSKHISNSSISAVITELEAYLEALKDVEPKDIPATTP